MQRWYHRWVRRALVALAIVAGVADANPGKVVRVERRVRAPAASPRVCQMTASGAGRCVGHELPRIGEVVVVMDQTRIVAELVIKTVHETSATCRNVWAVETAITRGAVQPGSLGLVADGDLHAARMLEAAGISPPTPGDRVVAAIDRDGDSREDIVITGSSCDPNNPSADWACIDVWSDAGDGMQRRERVRIKDCL
jgi:hypothetical protein